VEASAREEAGASLATGTKWRSASALAAGSRRTVLEGRKKDEIGAEGWRDGGREYYYQRICAPDASTR
jgi:hypothetical protein